MCTHTRVSRYTRTHTCNHIFIYFPLFTLSGVYIYTVIYIYIHSHHTCHTPIYFSIFLGVIYIINTSQLIISLSTSSLSLLYAYHVFTLTFTYHFPFIHFYTFLTFRHSITQFSYLLSVCVYIYVYGYTYAHACISGSCFSKNIFWSSYTFENLYYIHLEHLNIYIYILENSFLKPFMTT
jgi:hypothetical protein